MGRPCKTSASVEDDRRRPAGAAEPTRGSPSRLPDTIASDGRSERCARAVPTTRTVLAQLGHTTPQHLTRQNAVTLRVVAI